MNVELLGALILKKLSIFGIVSLFYVLNNMWQNIKPRLLIYATIVIYMDHIVLPVLFICNEYYTRWCRRNAFNLKPYNFSYFSDKQN